MIKLTLKIAVILGFILSTSCDDAVSNDLLPNITVNYIVNMNLPQYSGLQIPGVSKETPSNIGVQGILIYNFNGSYKAFDLACPHLPVNSCAKMEFDGSILLTCTCDDATFSIYDGSPQTNGVANSAREYHVEILGGNQLRITNY